MGFKVLLKSIHCRYNKFLYPDMEKPLSNIEKPYLPVHAGLVTKSAAARKPFKIAL
jgi:hypothetical protein